MGSPWGGKGSIETAEGTLDPPPCKILTPSPNPTRITAPCRPLPQRGLSRETQGSTSVVPFIICEISDRFRTGQSLGFPFDEWG